MAAKKHLILVDGSSYLFRAFHALPPLVNSKRQATGAVKGVINMVRSLIKSYPDSHIAVVFDAKGKTFRSDIYKEYKAHRPPMPDELRSQIAPIHDIIRAMGLPLLSIPGVEADDVIGTLADQAKAAQIQTLISTGDKDLAQLVNDHVTLMNTMTNEMLDTDGVKSKFGIGPEQIIDYLALMGDKADNIPGVPGVGPKTAVKWLLEYGDMNGVIENADKIAGKVGERLRDNLDSLRLSYELATVKLDVSLDVDINTLIAVDEDKQSLYQLFSELEFKSWVKELEQQGISGASDESTGSKGNTETQHDNADKELSQVDVSANEIDYKILTSHEEFTALLEALSEVKEFSINLEVQGEHFLNSEIIGISCSKEYGKSIYIPMGHVESIDDEKTEFAVSADQLDCEYVLNGFKRILENPDISKSGYNLKEQAHFLQNYDITLAPFKSDVLLLSYVRNSVASKHQLEAITRQYLDFELQDIAEHLGKGKNKLTLKQLPIDTLATLACQKADAIYRLSHYLSNELQNTGHLAGVYQYYEIALIPALQTMERNGIALASDLLESQSAELAIKLGALEKQAYELAGEEFNLGSPKQLQAIFYEKLKLPILKKTKTGQPSTAEPILQELAEEHELPRLILEQRSLSKLKSTYTDKLPLDVNPQTGRIHSSFQQAVAATGRLSSMDPNLQNIPIRTAEGRRVRQAFVPQPGYKLIAADYSQVELRIMAHLSQDPGLLKAFTSAEDVHRATASDVFSVALDEVTANQRRSAKAINFGLIYGMSAFGLANQLNISRGDAQEYVDRYFEKYPGVRTYMDETQALADENGYVETLFGRRLYLPDIHAGNGMLRKAAQRTAINAPMQGTAADIIKRAMVEIDHWLALGELDARMLLQVHDELVFEVSEADLGLLADGVRFRMVTAASMDVPLLVDIGVGNNWDEAH